MRSLILLAFLLLPAIALTQACAGDNNEHQADTNSNAELESTATDELDFDTAADMQSEAWQGQEWQQQQQPIRHFNIRQRFSAPLLQQQQQQPVHQQKSLRYSAPIVTYSQPIVQKVDLAAPKVQKQHLTAQAIVQPTYQTAPVMHSAAISTTAPTMRKGYGTSAQLGSLQQQNINNQQQQQFAGLGSSSSSSSKSRALSYSAPTVTYAQPIVEKVDMTPPKLQKQMLTAQPIVQSSFQIAPVMRPAAISTTAPTMRKGFGTQLGLGSMNTWQNQQQQVGLGSDNLESDDSAETSD